MLDDLLLDMDPDLRGNFGSLDRCDSYTISHDSGQAASGDGNIPKGVVKFSSYTWISGGTRQIRVALTAEFPLGVNGKSSSISFLKIELPVRLSSASSH